MDPFLNTTGMLITSPSHTALAPLVSPLATSVPPTVTVLQSGLNVGVTVTLVTAYSTAAV